MRNVENNDGMTPLDCCAAGGNGAAWRMLKHASGGQASHRKYEARGLLSTSLGP